MFPNLRNNGSDIYGRFVLEGDETYIRARGEWKYLYRAVDYQCNTVDFLLSEHRDIAAATSFFKKAIESHGTPEKISLDGYTATHTAVRELKKSAILPMNVCVRTSKHLNNVIEQDERRVKRRVYPMHGYKQFGNASVKISGIELAHKFKKGQFDTSTVEEAGVRVQHLGKQCWLRKINHNILIARPLSEICTGTHCIGKEGTQCIERNNLNFRTHLKRLQRDDLLLKGRR
jgi:DDE domain/IS1 transposase